MQEIGTWTTEEGTVSATLMLESETDDVAGQELPAWASGAISGALGGAATGAVGGPWGVIAGAATGAVLGGAAAASAPKPSAPPPASSASAASSAAGTPAAGTQGAAIQALQQFAAAIPALIQAVSASNAAKTAKASEWSDAEAVVEFVSDEVQAVDEWAWASEEEGAWSIP